MKFLKFFVLTLLCICLIAGSVFAQRLTGKITGTVSDADGMPLPGVRVEISSPSLLGGVHAQVTSIEGSYRFINLPPGTYKLVFKLEGFTTLDRENVRVSVAKTVTENIVLQQATIKESITVTTAAPTIDVTQSGISYVFSKDELEKLPSGRNTFFDIIKFSPGLQQTWQEGGRMVTFGSNTESNSFRMDGVELKEPDGGLAWLEITQEAFEEVETFGLGSPAEFGQYTGVVVNIVTKSGSNRFQGALSYYGQFQSLTADNNIKKVLDPDIPPEEAYLYPDSAYSFHRKKYYYASFNLGGPIVKDRLWFFGTYEKLNDSTTYWNMYPGYAVNNPMNKVFFKLSAQLANRHKLAGSIYYEDSESPGYPYWYQESSTLSISTRSTYSWNFMYTWQLSNSAFIDLKYAGFRGSEDYLPQSGDMDTPPHWDWATGEVRGGLAGQAWLWTLTRHQAHANLSYFADDFLGGDHEFKIGVQFNRGDSRYPIEYIGERWYYDYYGTPWYMYQRDVFYAGGAVDSFGAFVDDSWKIGDRLTLNFGIRFDYNNGFVPEYPVVDNHFIPTSEKTPAVKDVVVWNVFSPRIGLAFQLTSDQKTLLKASYGRYYDALMMSNWAYPGPNVTDWNVYYYDFDIDEWVFWYSYPGASNYIMDPNLKSPCADQFSLGLERELLPDFKIGATYIYKKQKDLMGLEDRAGIYEEVSMVSEYNGQTYTLFNQTNVGTKEIWVTNPSNYEQIYQAVMFTLNKRYSNNWMLGVSLTYSKSEGLTTIGHDTSANQSGMIWFSGGFGSDLNDLINAYGRMQNDRPWILKVQAGYTFPWDILASINYIYQTGRPNPSIIGFYLDQGWRSVLAEPRGDDRFPNWSMLDFRLQKTFNIGDIVKFHAIFDLFNVFNNDTVTWYDSHNMWSSLYQHPNWVFYPRRLQIGLKLQF